MVGTGMTSDADRVCTVRYFIEDAGILSLFEGAMNIAEMHAYVRGQRAR